MKSQAPGILRLSDELEDIDLGDVNDLLKPPLFDHLRPRA